MSDADDTLAADASLDRHDLYEACVQSTAHLVPLLRAIHGDSPTGLGEDFAGTAALSHAWVESVPEGQAVAVDLDVDTLTRHGNHARIVKTVGDVRTVTESADVLFVGNFSIGYLHDRPALVDYLRHARGRLEPGGVFICDTYGGESSFVTSDVHRYHSLPDGSRVRYTWEQRAADPLTGRVLNALHFRVERGGFITQELHDAFVYDWRLWSVPELRDALAEAGFVRSDVYCQLPDAVDDEGNAYITPTEAAELEDSFIVCVAGRVSQ